MLRNYLSHFKDHSRRMLQQEKKGQSIIIVTFAFLGLIAMLGLALDLGLVYIERVRVSRTTDAAALAAVVELPFEEEAMRRAIEYIELNGYRVGQDTEIRVRGCIVKGAAPTNVAEFGTGYPGSAEAGGTGNPDAMVDADPDSLTAGYRYIPATQQRRAVFVIDTLAYQPINRDGNGAVTTANKLNCTNSLYGTANKLRVSGEVAVNMNFMQFFGFGVVPVSDQAVGENVTNLDVVVVFDVSGSMDFETTCFGCWVEDTTKSALEYPFPLNGSFNPIRYDPDGSGPATNKNIFWQNGAAGDALCSQAPPASAGALKDAAGKEYRVHEAEFYSRDVPLHGWEFNQRQPGQGFWVVQRMGGGSNKAHLRAHVYTTYSQSDVANYPQLQGAAYNGECFSGPNLSGQCWKTKAATLKEQAPSSVPWVEYDFTPSWDGETHIWIRAIGGSVYAWEWNGRSPTQHTNWRKTIYWQVDSKNVRGGPFDNVLDGSHNKIDDDDWRWIKLGSETTQKGVQSVLKLYQGSSGFNVDKIIFTNNPSGQPGSAVNNNGTAINETIGGTDGNALRNILKLNGGEGPAATPGSATREACNMCNPAFGQTPALASQCSCRKTPTDTAGSLYPGGGTGVGCTSLISDTNQLEDDLFHDKDPIRSAQEAVKNFAARLDPKFDQIGFVAYSSGIKEPRVKLQCLRYAGSGHAGAGGVAKCFDESTNPISYTKVISAVEAHNPQGGTRISAGMREGLEELGIKVSGFNENVDSECSSGSNPDDGHACDRRGAARRVLILMTDGSPNEAVTCGALQWRGKFGANHPPYNCSIYYAQQAADNNVTVYTIGIGSGVNVELLTAMATGTDPNPKTGDNGFYFEGKGGKYYPAAQPDDLDAIFADILKNIYVRIVG